MKCASCHRPINSADAVRRAEYRLQRDGTVKVFGHGMPDGPLSAAAGQLIKAKHNGCYHAERKREQRAEGRQRSKEELLAVMDASLARGEVTGVDEEIRWLRE